MNFLNLVIRIFKSHGFEINSTSNYSKYILAIKDNITVSIGFSEPGEEPNVSSLRNFIRTSKKDNSDRLIYILPKAYPDNIERFANDRNIQLWDSERLEREIGRAIVTDLNKPGETVDHINELSEILSHDIETKDDDQDVLDTSTSESTADDDFVPIMVPVVPLGEYSDSAQDSSFNTDSEDQHRTETDESYSQTNELKEYRIVKLNVSKDTASSMANKIVKGFRFNLELIPYYIFDYICKYDLENEEESTHSGLLGINGLTSNVEDWSKHVETVRRLDEQHTKLEVKFPFEKAFSIAKHAVVDLNTKLIETQEEFESTIIFEKKKLKPKQDAITLNSKGIHYLPVWCIEGSNGLLIIDATSGKVIKEDIFKTGSLQDQNAVAQEP